MLIRGTRKLLSRFNRSPAALHHNRLISEPRSPKVMLAFFALGLLPFLGRAKMNAQHLFLCARLTRTKRAVHSPEPSRQNRRCNRVKSLHRSRTAQIQDMNFRILSVPSGRNPAFRVSAKTSSGHASNGRTQAISTVPVGKFRFPTEWCAQTCLSKVFELVGLTPTLRTVVRRPFQRTGILVIATNPGAIVRRDCLHRGNCCVGRALSQFTGPWDLARPQGTCSSNGADVMRATSCSSRSKV
jgi:hypothetical protein